MAEKKVTLAWVRSEVARITELYTVAQDDERGHRAEDDLHIAVLREIAKGDTRAAALAREALKTTEIDGGRWCA